MLSTQEIIVEKLNNERKTIESIKQFIESFEKKIEEKIGETWGNEEEK